jgi:hypothetical protein
MAIHLFVKLKYLFIGVLVFLIVFHKDLNVFCEKVINFKKILVKKLCYDFDKWECGFRLEDPTQLGQHGKPEVALIVERVVDCHKRVLLEVALENIVSARGQPIKVIIVHLSKTGVQKLSLLNLERTR